MSSWRGNLPCGNQSSGHGRSPSSSPPRLAPSSPLLSTPTSPPTRATCGLLCALLTTPPSGALSCPLTHHRPFSAPFGKALASTSMPSYQPAASRPLRLSHQRVPIEPCSAPVSDPGGGGGGGVKRQFCLRVLGGWRKNSCCLPLREWGDARSVLLFGF